MSAAGDPESWARLRLAQGESTALTLELTGSSGGTTLTVGQSPGCDWIVREAGVAPVHFSLHWDGSVLRIADVYGAGGVRLDGVLVGAQWRTVAGRVRIDFGKAAIVVETAPALQAGASTSEPMPLPPMAAGGDPRRAPVRPPQATKATLMGVAPIDASSLPPRVQSMTQLEPAEGMASGRPPKPTLLGMADGPGAGAGASPSNRPAASPVAMPGAAKVSNHPAPNPTLLGVGLVPSPDVVKGRRVGGSSLADDDQRTIQGFPLSPQVEARGPAGAEREPSAPFRHPSPGERRSMQHGTPSDLPPPARGAVHASIRAPSGTPAESQRPQAPQSVRPQAQPVSYAPPPSAGGAWHEVPGVQGIPGSYRPAETLVREPVPQAVMVPPHSARPPAPVVVSTRPEAPVAPSMRSHAPAMNPAVGREQPRTFESQAPKRGFPWRYVGVGALTAVAYFAWLYLLDHL